MSEPKIISNLGVCSCNRPAVKIKSGERLCAVCLDLGGKSMALRRNPGKPRRVRAVSHGGHLSGKEGAPS